MLPDYIPELPMKSTKTPLYDELFPKTNKAILTITLKTIQSYLSPIHEGIVSPQKKLGVMLVLLSLIVIVTPL
jgi:hypothetical protein